MFDVDNETIRERVQRGAILLDKKCKRWFLPSNIDIISIDMRSVEKCILGQLYGDFDIGLDEMGVDIEDLAGEIEDYGFDCPSHPIANYYDDLDLYMRKRAEYYSALEDAWRDEINMRRMQATIYVYEAYEAGRKNEDSNSGPEST